MSASWQPSLVAVALRAGRPAPPVAVAVTDRTGCDDPASGRRRGSVARALALRVGLVTAWLIAGTSLPEALSQSRDAFREARHKLVADAIEREGIKNPRVLMAMRETPRHEFVPLSLRSLAYIDAALAIGAKQTISPPFIVAYMTEALDPQPDDVVLEIGTGSGYQAAVLSPLVKHVYTIEIVESLGKQAAERLKRLDYKNVTVKVGDGYLGWPEHAPFDKIIVTCSPEDVPKPLVAQLKEGGKMIVPLGERYQQVFHLFEKQNGELKATRLINTLFVPMTGASETERDVQPDPLKPQIFNGGFEVDANDDGLPDRWHYLRGLSIAEKGGPNGTRCAHFEVTEPGRPGQALQGMAVDGRQVTSVRVALQYRLEATQPGRDAHERPGAMIHFYDDQRRVIAEPILATWTTTTGWERMSKTVPVPPKAREMIFRVGLNGASGSLYVDDVELVPLLK